MSDTHATNVLPHTQSCLSCWPSSLSCCPVSDPTASLVVPRASSLLVCGMLLPGAPHTWVCLPHVRKPQPLCAATALDFRRLGLVLPHARLWQTTCTCHAACAPCPLVVAPARSCGGWCTTYLRCLAQRTWLQKQAAGPTASQHQGCASDTATTSAAPKPPNESGRLVTPPSQRLMTAVTRKLRGKRRARRSWSL